ncbi:MAG: tetratricopeptide repeat protein [Alphaproteobacteria bacterium]
MHKLTKLAVIALATTQLTACNTLSESRPEREATQSEKIDAALEKAAAQSGNQSASLIALEKQYKLKPENASSALAYATGLRHAGYLNRAKMILEPFGKEQTVAGGVNTEMSMIALGLGNYNSAENYAQKAVLQDPEDYNAYQNLGIALDAKEMHPEAERAFRKGLEHWQGDPTTIMNNLALNLATQGFIDEAVEVLERAKALSPDRIELERNLRIIRTLNER